jgi:predicted AAA+ superfamily ATPase
VQYLRENGLLRSPITYIFLDEIQLLENPSNFLKLLHDHHPELKLIVTGSSTFAIRSKFKDSLVGRTVNFELFPLSFQEFLIFKEEKMEITKPISTLATHQHLKRLFTEYVLFGGFPRIVLTEDRELKEVYLRQIVDTYIKADIRDLGQIRQIDKFNKLLRILAQQSGSLLNLTELSVTTGISRPTLEDYLFLLENTYVIRRVPPFATNIRKELFKRPKIFFLDTGLMHILSLRTVPEDFTGHALETAIFTEFIKNFPENPIYYWRTRNGNEIDFILEMAQEIQAFEVKRNSAQLKSSELKSFQQRYQARVSCICLEKTRILPQVNMLYPWELYTHLQQK